MVQALVCTLKNLKKDVDLAQFLRLVQHNAIAIIIVNGAKKDRQTPQVAISPHTKLTFRKRYEM
jgi:hypothetical protein